MVTTKQYAYYGNIEGESFYLQSFQDIMTFCEYYSFPRPDRRLYNRLDFEEQRTKWYMWKLFNGIDFQCRIMED